MTILRCETLELRLRTGNAAIPHDAAAMHLHLVRPPYAQVGSGKAANGA
jgi:hypothetical protein